MFLETVILSCLKQLNGQRTTSNVYHLLTGKKAIQTIQDAHVYQLHQFYGIYKRINKKELDHYLIRMREQGLIVEKSNKQAIFTVAKESDLTFAQHDKKYPIHYLQGMKYAGAAEVFYNRLILLIQTLTNSHMRHYTFMPVVDQPEAERWVKRIYVQVKGKEYELLQSLYQELNDVLQQVTTMEAELFVDRFTGYKHYGMSLGQLSERYQLKLADVTLLLVAITHRIMTTALENKHRFKVLYYMIPELNEQTVLTKSAEQTYQFWKKGKTIREIADLRRLKEATIHDHLVEIAFYEDDFPLHLYIDRDQSDQIQDAIKKVNNYKLKEIKQLVDEQISYFQIRLVLAYYKKGK